MSLRNTFLKASLVVASTLGAAPSAQAQSFRGPAPEKTATAVTTNDVNKNQDIKPTEYTIANYETWSNKGEFLRKAKIEGRDQRYTYVSLWSEYSTKSISLANTVTTPENIQTEEDVAFETIEEGGNLYFAHGYDKFSEKDIVQPDQMQSVDLNKIAKVLISKPAFSLRMTGHADTSGDRGKNYDLSKKRLETGKKMLLIALEKQGLSKAEAKDIYDKRVAPHTTLIAQGQDDGPVETADGVKEQANRVVVFQMIVQRIPQQVFTSRMLKSRDFDNHEHTVILWVASNAKQKEIEFYPEEDTKDYSLPKGQMSVADENVNFIIKKISRDPVTPFIIKHFTPNNLVADNTNFLIENNSPGAVKSTYNFDTGMIDVSINDTVVLSIDNMSDRIDPALIRIGQVDREGNVVISPLTNAADVAPISESRLSNAENNVLTQTADRILHLSIDAKHLNIENAGDDVAYQQALKDYGFAEKLNDAFKNLQNSGIETSTYEQFVLKSYTDPQSAYYAPKQIVFPFQTYEGLRQSQPVTPGAKTASGQADAYKELLVTMKNSPSAKPSLQQNGKVAAWAPTR